MRFRPFVSAEAMLKATSIQAEETASTMPQGIPSGGTTGQVLKKASNSNYDATWQDESGGGGLALDYMRLSNTDTTTSINTGSMTEIPLATEAGPGTNFTKSGNGIQTDFDGTIEISASVHMTTSTVQRAGVALEYFKGGNSLGPRFNTSYIRRASGHNEASCACLPLIVDCADGDVFTLRGIAEAASGTVTMSAADRAYFQIKRLA